MTTTYADRKYLLPQAMQAVSGWGQFGYPDYHSGIVRDDDENRIGFYGPFNPNHRPIWKQFVFAAKRTFHRDHFVSFMPKILSVALTKDANVCLFVGEGPYTIDDAWVFDSRRAINRRQERVEEVDSKRQTGVPVFDVARRENGITVREYLKDPDRLPGPTKEVDTTPTTLRMFDIEPSEDI